MTLYVYAMSPIDIWTGWRSNADIIGEFHNMGEEAASLEFIGDVVRAMEAAKRTGFDGELREAIHVAPLPRAEREPYGGPRWMFGIKQDNNGTTFIVSPYPLGWLGAAHEVTL